MKKIWFFLLISSAAFAQPPGEWTWMKGSTIPNAPGVFGTIGVPNPANTPPSFYEAVEWTDLSGNFWLFGGSDGSMGLWADLWKYNPASNQWTWVKGPGFLNPPGIYGTQGVPAPANYPPPRVAGGTWVDASGNLWLCGGGDYFASPRNDLWRYNIATNQWTWMKGSNTTSPSGTYGTMGVPAPANTPGGRTELGTTWSDNNYLWIFGGYGLNGSFSTGALSDVWRYDITTNQWTWMSGSQNIGDPAVYGTIGVPNPANTPGGRYAYTKWKDASNNFWFFGGKDDSGDNFSDLWRYNSGTGMWTWMSGSNLTNMPGIQGTPCTPATGNRPVCKYENRVCWIDNCGNMWSCGGTDNGGFTNTYDDLWMYNPTTNQWTFISGSMASNVTPMYGTVTVSAPTNRPGGRCGQNAWIDPATGNLFMFGGGIPTFPTCRNDLWRYVPNPSCGGCSSLTQPLVVTASPDTTVCAGFCANISVSAVGGDPPYTYSWTPNVGNGTGPYQVCPNVTTTYYILVTDSLGITATDSVTITVNQPPVLTTSSPASVCGGTPATLTVSGASTYTWFPCTNITPCTGSSVTATPPVSTSYTVIGTDVNGCMDTAIYAVNVFPNPSPTITPSGPLIFCSGNSVDLTANPTGTYLWSSGPSTQTIHVTQTGTFTVVVTDTNGCTGTSAPVNVTVSPPPTLSSFASALLCNGDSSGSITVNAFGGIPPYAYQWSPSGGTNPTEVNLSAGMYTVVVTDSIGCSQTLIDTVTEPPPVALLLSSLNTECDSLSGQAVAVASGGTPGYSYLWSTSQIADSLFQLAGGTYTVTMTDAHNCMVSDSVVVGVNPGNIPISISADTSILIGASAQLYASGGTSYYWQPLTGLNCVICSDPLVHPEQTTDYCVRVSDSSGCYDTACMRVTVLIKCQADNSTIFVPDAFSPNDDGMNDMLYVLGGGMKEFYFALYDRWGERVFETTDQTKGWDGAYKGKRVDPAVFIYVLKAKCAGGGAIYQKGNVSLLK